MPPETVMRPPADVPLTLVTLGGFALRDAQGTQLLGPGKPLALLAYLAASPGRTASREHLIDLLWADADPERARHALRQSLWQLRQLLGEHGIDGKEEVRITGKINLDRNRFLAAIEAGDLESAIALYGGPFIAAFASPGGAAFEHWADAERNQLQAAFLRAAELHARRLLAKGRPRDVIAVSRRIKEADPGGQVGPRLLIEAHLACGDALSAASEAERLTWNAREAEMELEPATEAMVRRALGRSREDHPSGPMEPTATSRLTADLVGREQEFATALAAWASARQGTMQHLHVVGAAGLGKTRLLLDLEARLKSAGARVRYLRAHPGDRDLPSALASELARALVTLPGAKGVSPDVAATLVALDPALASHYDVQRDTATGHEAIRRRTLALAELARAIAEESPFGLLIDDLHWADTESLTILEGLLPRIERTPILVVTATRPLATSQLRSESRQTLSLQPLGLAQVTELLESLARFPNPTVGLRLAEQLHSATGGNPLMVLELLSLASERGVLQISEERWVGPALASEAPVFVAQDGIRQRIERLGPETRRVLGLLALAGTPLERDLVAASAGIEPAALMEHLTVLERLGYIEDRRGSIEPTHDEIAAAAATVDPALEAELRRALGGALEVCESPSLSTLTRAARQYAAIGEVESVGRLVRQAQALANAGVVSRRTLQEWISLLVGADPGLQARVRATLPLRWRYPVWQAATIAGTLAVLIGGAAWYRTSVQAQESMRVERAAVFEVVWEADGLPSWRAARLVIDPLNWDPTAPLSFEPAVPRPEPYVNWTMRGSYLGRGDSLLIPSTEDSALAGSQEVLLLTGGTVRPVAQAQRDDVAPGWTVDGRGFLFTTARWNGNGPYDYSIGYARLSDDSVRPIANTPAKEDFPVQSIDGTRIVFSEYDDAALSPRLCVVPFDGTGKHCGRIEGARAVLVVDWLDHEVVLAHVSYDDRSTVERINVRSWTRDAEIASGVATAVLDQGGEILACLCTDPADGKRRIRIARLGSPREGAWVDPPSEFPIAQLLAVKGRRNRPYLDRLEILSDSVAPTGRQHKLRVVGRDAAGRLIAFDTTSVRWRLVDGSGGTIDSLTGVITVLNPGTFEISVSAGGWRMASKRIRFVRPPAATVFEETWSQDSVSARWRVFGRPAPAIGATRPLGAAFFPNGDDSYPSGAYTTSSWRGDQGLTLEFLASTPLNSPRHQSLTVSFRATADSAVLRQWDHRTGGPPGLAASSIGECGFGFPPGETTASWSEVVIATFGGMSVQSLPVAIADGSPRRWRVSVFPDGRCGLAIDSIPIAVSRTSISMRFPLRVWIMSQSHNTTIAVGSMRLWRGDPGGVDWSALQQD